MATKSLTLLQSCVIQRLRDAGYETVANRAEDRWAQGRSVEGAITLPGYVPTRHRELIADFILADEQAAHARS